MKKYDKNSTHHILEMIKNNCFNEALILCYRYLEMYPEDYYIYPYFANLLIRFGRFEEAEEVLNSVVISSKVSELTVDYIKLVKLKLLCNCGKYQEGLEFIRENYNLFEERIVGITEILFFLKKRLGLLEFDFNYSDYSYKLNQIVCYNEEYVINHIYCWGSRSSNLRSYFNENFPLEQVYHEIRKMLPLENTIYHGIIDNFSIFKYVNNGRVNGKSVDYIKVITLNGTSDILEMYPYENKEKISYIDLTPVEKENISKIKRLSQIEKFNQRYSKN